MENHQDNSERMVTLRSLEYEDLQFLCAVRNDKLTYPYLHTPYKFSIEETKEWFHRTQPDWLIILVNDVEVGYIRISNKDQDNKAIKVGMDIHPKYRGKGIATEAYHKLFNKLYVDGWRIVSLEVLSHNVVAKRLYDNLGFKAISINKLSDKLESITMIRLLTSQYLVRKQF